MPGRPQNLTKGQKEEVTSILRRQVVKWVLIGFTILAGITGLSLWGIKQRVEKGMEDLVGKQFEEPRIQNVVSNVAETKAKALLIEQINPQVERFKAEVASQLAEMRSLVAKTDTLKSQSDSNAKQIEAILASVRSSQQKIEKVKGAVFGLQSDLIKLERGLVEIQYFTYKGRNIFPNPYHERIIQKLNELLAIAVPDPQERAKFVKEMEEYQPKK